MKLPTSALALALAAALAAAPAWAQDHTAQMAMQADAAPIVIGQLELNAPFARATLPNAPVAGGFLTIVNSGTEDDRLVSASVDFAKDAQIHEMAMEGTVMKMRQLPDGLVIPAGETVVLEPGGYHLMFMGLSQPLVEGETVPVTLTFEKAGTITIDLHIAGAAADAPADHMKH